jgi:hypothetical protein
MNRRINTLALTLAAALAATAVAASSALAIPQFTAEAYPVTIHGSNTKATSAIEMEAGVIECDTNFHAVLSEPSSTLNVTPNYTNCDAFEFLEAEVNEEGCSYVFHATEKTAGDKYKAHTDVTCPVGQSIKISVFTCRAEVKAQTGLTSAVFTNDTAASPKKDMTLVFDITADETNKKGGIAYTVTQDGAFCPFNLTGNKVGGQYLAEGTTLTGQSATNPETKIGVNVAGE